MDKALLDLIPLASLWAEEKEAFILANGIPLSVNIIKDAQPLGIKSLNKVRVLVVEEIPLPSDEILKKAITEMGFIGKNTIGLSLRYGIFVKSPYENDKRLLIHELTHTMQYERAGGFLQFLTQYIKECIEFGYPNGNLEQEAINFTDRICK